MRRSRLEYGLYPVGVFGREARIDASRILTSFDGFPKNLREACSTPYEFDQNEILLR